MYGSILRLKVSATIQLTSITYEHWRGPPSTDKTGPGRPKSFLRKIQILSPSDSVDSMQERIDDYLQFGVAHVWLLNPRNLRAFHYTSEGMREAKDGILKTDHPAILLPVRELENL